MVFVCAICSNHFDGFHGQSNHECNDSLHTHHVVEKPACKMVRSNHARDSNSYYDTSLLLLISLCFVNSMQSNRHKKKKNPSTSSRRDHNHEKATVDKDADRAVGSINHSYYKQNQTIINRSILLSIFPITQSSGKDARNLLYCRFLLKRLVYRRVEY